MNSINTTNNSRKRKYTDIDNADIRGVKSIKDIRGRRHTVNIAEPKFTEMQKNKNYKKNISVKNKNMSKISGILSLSREYSLSVKIRNSQKKKR